MSELLHHTCVVLALPPSVDVLEKLKVDGGSVNQLWEADVICDGGSSRGSFPAPRRFLLKQSEEQESSACSESPVQRRTFREEFNAYMS